MSTEVIDDPHVNPALEALRWRIFRVPVGEHGYVALVDAMGSDAAIAQAARVSYGKGTKTVHDDEGLIRYLMRRRHCYDAETEVLTDVGFVPWATAYDVWKEDGHPKLGIWDDAAGSLCYEEPEYVTQDFFEGKMYRVDHGGVDLLVTPEHSMWVKRKRWNGKQMVWTDSFALIPAEKLGSSSMVRYSKLAPYVLSPDFQGTDLPFRFDNPRELLRLFGFFIGDGSVDQTAANGIVFKLKKRRKRAFLEEVCTGLGWEYRPLAGASITVRATGISEFFRRTFYDADGDKRIPSLLQSLNRDDSLALLDGLRASDGSLKRGAWEYTTSVESVAEAIQIIALHAGEAAHVNQRIGGMWGVMVLSRMREPVINQVWGNTSQAQYRGDVYCAKTRTGVLVVRRNGKIVLSGNTTPFEMCEVKLLVQVPMDAWRQWIRHRTASTNEYSTRYSEAIDERATTRSDRWRLQAAGNRQGSGGDLVDWPAGFEGGQVVTPGEYLTDRELELHHLSEGIYKERLRFGIAREQARKDLPLSTYTQAYWKIDLHNLIHFLSLRMDSHAQFEIRSYATTIGRDIVAKLFPLTWQAFLDYVLDAIHLTTIDQEVLRRILTTATHAGAWPPFDLDFFRACQLPEWRGKKHVRERDECVAKLAKMGVLGFRQYVHETPL